jgi:hypothetical protein
VGGFLAYSLDKRAARTGGRKGASIRERGIVIASGLMAGGALGGVLGAAMRLIPGFREDLIPSPIYGVDAAAQLVSIVGFLAFVAYVWWMSQRTREN